jgi:hypothetical protein
MNAIVAWHEGRITKGALDVEIVFDLSDYSYMVMLALCRSVACNKDVDSGLSLRGVTSITHGACTTLRKSLLIVGASKA